MLIDVLKVISEAENDNFKKPRSTNKITVKENGVAIDSIEDEKPLTDSESCVEYLILSFCHNFSLKAKQGAGLLAQGCKYLAHLIAKGLKGDFEPVRL